MDIWQYIKSENIQLPHLYFSHQRDCFVRDGVIMGVTDFIELLPGEKVEKMVVRFRTIGDATCTGACLSTADNIDDIIDEVAVARQTERGTRADDKRSETAMEDRKKEGEFLRATKYKSYQTQINFKFYTKMSEDNNSGYLDMDLLRFTTAGSVDDGKSTLIGRLLYDSKAIFEDQLEAMETSSKARGDEV